MAKQSIIHLYDDIVQQKDLPKVKEMISNYLQSLNGLTGVVKAMIVRMEEQLQNNMIRTMNVSNGPRLKERLDIQNLQTLLSGQVSKM